MALSFEAFDNDRPIFSYLYIRLNTANFMNELVPVWDQNNLLLRSGIESLF